MRERNREVVVRFSEKELADLDRKVARSGQTRENFIRASLADKEIKELPPVDFINILQELREINLVMKYLELYSSPKRQAEFPEYKRQCEKLSNAIGELMRQMYR